MIRSWIFLLVLSIYSGCGYKFLVYSPMFGYSHMNFMGAIADTLTEAAHNVTVLMPRADIEYENRTGVRLTKRVIKTATHPVIVDMLKYGSEMSKKAWSTERSSLYQMMKNMTTIFASICEGVVNDDKLMKTLEEEKFDVGIASAFSICGLGLFEVLRIPASIVTFPGVHMDVISQCIGEPTAPSYVPGGTTTKGDRMGFIDRLINAGSAVFMKIIFTRIYDEEIEVLRKKYGSNFKNYEELIADGSFVFTNSNPYLDYPRPLIYKTVPIGGITVSADPDKAVLPQEWINVLNLRNTTVLVSFGSAAKSIYMPDVYKKTLLKVFESFPSTTFIWKYEEEKSNISSHLINVHLRAWVPQNALLADPRLTVFVTHAGLGSTTELAHLGKPAVLIPLYADQTRNAYMFSKHGGGIVLNKHDLENPQKLIDALNMIFNNASFTANAKRLSKLLLNPPISAKQRVARYSEFVAKFGRLPNLDPYGRHLTLFKYYLVDVIFFVVGVVIVVVVLVALVIRRCCYASVKSKMD